MKSILQTCVPAYRVPVFKSVADLVEDFRVVAGDYYFTPNLETVAYQEPWFKRVVNRFVFRKKFCWQRGMLGQFRDDDSIIAEFNPRILSSWLLFVTRKLRGRRSLFWGHVNGRGQRGILYRIIRRSMLSLSDGVILYTQTDARQLLSEGYKGSIWVTQNSCLSEEACAPVSGCQTDFIYVGRIVQEKKVDLLIRGFAELSRSHPEAKLQVVGDGPERSKCESLARSLGVADKVSFWGMRNDSVSLREAYKNCVAAVSTGYVGLSAIQALGNGIPMLVASAEPHSPEIEACDEGRTALFFESNSLGSLVETMETVLRQKELWLRKRVEISTFIRENYTTEHMAKVLADALTGKGDYEVVRADMEYALD